MTYVPLGVRTEYSFQDGMCRIEPLVERARTLRLGAVGIADLHSAFALVPFYAAARAAGIRPILGVTVRVRGDVAEPSWGQEPAEMKLFARNAAGYRNLLHLLTRSALETDGGAPVVDFQDLERFAAGVMALDGGLAGPVARSLARGAREGAEQVAARLRETYGADGFCIEVQRQGTPAETLLEPFVTHVARRLNVPLVAGCDVRYLEPADAEAHMVLRCVGEGTVAAWPSQQASGEPHLLRSEAEMRHLFRDLPEALANTCLVAERCQVDLAPGAAVEYPTRSGRPALEELRREIERGLRQRFGSMEEGDLPVAVRDRVAHELAVIEEMELASCFLIAQDVVRHTKEEGIFVGPGRGPAAGSLICNLIGITAIDPLEHGLLFERFVSRGTGRAIEFEFDVEHRQRDAVVSRVLAKLGPDRAAMAASIVTLSTRSVVREVAQALGFEPAEIDSLARSLHADGASDLWQALDRSNDLKRAYQDDARVRRLLDVARRLEGLPRNPTLHAGGVLVAPDRIADHAALQRGRSGESLVQLTSEGAAGLGLLRLEFVSSRALTVLGDAMQHVGERKGIALALETLPLEDEATFRLLGEGDTHGVPQFEGPNVQALAQALGPANFADLVAVLCLARPGARFLVQRFLACRRDGVDAEVLDERLRGILGSTHGLVLYQEQVMVIAAQLGGFDSDATELFRQALQRRRIGDLARYRARFVRGAVERGMELEHAEEIFAVLLRFSNFDFDKAHAVATARVGYGCAWMRTHHPLEYAAALLDDSIGQSQRMRETLVDTLGRGIDILPVDVNRSAAGFEIEGDVLRMGLEAVKRLGDEEAFAIAEERSRRGAFESLHDFCLRLPDLGAATVENLAKAGAFQSLGISRAQALAELTPALAAATRATLQEDGGQLELAFVDSIAAQGAAQGREIDEFDAEALVALEAEALDASLSEARAAVARDNGQPVLRFPDWRRTSTPVSQVSTSAGERLWSSGSPPQPNAERPAGSPQPLGFSGVGEPARRSGESRSALRRMRRPATSRGSKTRPRRAS